MITMGPRELILLCFIVVLLCVVLYFRGYRLGGMIKAAKAVETVVDFNNSVLDLWARYATTEGIECMPVGINSTFHDQEFTRFQTAIVVVRQEFIYRHYRMVPVKHVIVGSNSGFTFELIE